MYGCLCRLTSICFCHKLHQNILLLCLSKCGYFFQSFGIGYRQLHPEGQVRVHSDDPRPIIRVKPDADSGYRRYGFVDAVLGLDPVGKLGLTSSDYKVS